MSFWITCALLTSAGVLAIPVTTFLLECSCAVGWKPRPRHGSRPAGARSIIMIPAHNEELGIRQTLDRLKSQLTSNDSVLVIADNCTDATASVARECGAEVIERHHPTERGKGYALSFGTAHIAKVQTPPDVVIVLDADCIFTSGSVEALVADCLERGRPMQSDDVLVAAHQGEVDIKTKISIFAFRVKNTLRPRGLDRIGMPRQLAGTGMAFPWVVLRDAPNMRGWVTEDLVLGLELAILGAPAYLCPDACVESEVAPSPEGHSTQRQRWEHGHLAAMRKYVPLLIREGLRQRKLELIVLATDLAVPPLALLASLVFGGCVAVLATAPLGAGWLPVFLMSGEAAALALGVGIAWSKVGRDLMNVADSLKIPLYVVSKAASYSSWVRGRGHSTWIRAERRTVK